MPYHIKYKNCKSYRMGWVAKRRWYEIMLKEKYGCFITCVVCSVGNVKISLTPMPNEKHIQSVLI